MYRDSKNSKAPRRKLTGLFVVGVVLLALGLIPTLLAGWALVITLIAATNPNPGLALMGASVDYMFVRIILPLAAIAFAFVGAGVFCIRKWWRRSTPGQQSHGNVSSYSAH